MFNSQTSVVSIQTVPEFPNSVTSIQTDRNYEMKCVEIMWLFDTRADAHVMPQHVWSQLGEPELEETTMT